MSGKSVFRVVLASFLALLGRPAAAEVVEPNGVAVPLNSNNGETQLSELFSSRGESIDFIADGSATPDTFSPLCGFKATFVLKQSGSSLGVGWYNADPARTAAPSSAEVYAIMPAGSPVGAAVVGADIRSNANYLGGSIGFALLRSPLYFTEARYNPACTLCVQPGPWILSVSYPSTQSANAFYVAFEDGDANAITWSNDGDFNDYVFYFEGLSCVGEGESCEVEGAQGVCIPGIRECDATGALLCKGVVDPSDEVCDAVDNDCDGSTDEGDGLCAASEVCSAGQCVPRCGVGEFICTVPPFTQCKDGLCLDPACVDKVCNEGQACVAGMCRAACDGVVCPVGQVCRTGTCVDPCDGVTCASDRVCSGGACVLGCDCAGCPAGRACELSSRLCVDEGCQTLSCTADQVCVRGVCIDPCDQAQCPSGTVCTAGSCVAAQPVVAPATGGVPGGTGGAASLGSGGTAIHTGSFIAAGTGDAGVDSGSSQPTRSGSSQGAAGGCGCRVAACSASSRPWNGALWLPLLLLLYRRIRQC